MNAILKSALVAAGMVIATQAVAQVTFYEGQGFEGRSFTMQRWISDFRTYGFNDRASSVVVSRDRWEVCEDIRFGGSCIVLRQGRYPSLSSMGLNNRISSARIIRSNARIANSRYAPYPDSRDHDRRDGRYDERDGRYDQRDGRNNDSSYQYRRRGDERLYQADVTSVRAVVGPPEQRCWIEREKVVQERSGPSVPGAIAGAVIGGILGHQIGGGSGKDIATAGGAVAGGVVGANVGRSRGEVTTQDVQRCSTTPSQTPAYWDVTYNFRNQDHRVQMAAAPGSTVTVNGQGEPRE